MLSALVRRLMFLDITIIKQHNNFKYNIYLKLMTIDTTIQNCCILIYMLQIARNDPYEQQTCKQELNTIGRIEHTNGFNEKCIQPTHKTIKWNNATNHATQQELVGKHWVIYTK